MRKKSILIIGIILIILLVDQLVKIWVKTTFNYQEPRPFIPNFIQLYYIENRGMAFGTTLGDGVWAKYVLSIFRFGAIIGIAVYIRKLIKANEVKLSFLITIALIFAGAAGNLIDGMFYDFMFPMDPLVRENWIVNEFGFPVYGADGEILLREGGFFLGSVVDMFEFTVKWPSWTPFDYAGKDIFPFVFNIADASISIGVAIIILRYRKFFKSN